MHTPESLMTTDHYLNKTLERLVVAYLLYVVCWDHGRIYMSATAQSE